MFTQTEFVAAHTSRSLSFAAIGFMDLIQKWATVEGTNGFFPEYKLAQIEGALDLATELVDNDEWVAVIDEGVIYGYRALSPYERSTVVADEEDDDVVIHSHPVEDDTDISDVAQEIIDEVSLEIEDEEYEERFSGSMEVDEDRTAEESHEAPYAAAEKMAALVGADRFIRGDRVSAPAPKAAVEFEEEELEDGFALLVKAYPHEVADTNRNYNSFVDAAERLRSIRDIIDLARGLSAENASESVSRWLKNLESI